MLCLKEDNMRQKNRNKIRFLAFYLPQFHPIPENDRWHGKGFTEWTNIVKTTPRFNNHYQPKLPADLGFYDLRVPEIRSQQAKLAKNHGIDGFVYYHYWFSGKRLLNRPFDEVLKLKKPNFPFCLCWANEGWSKKWGPTYGSNAKDKTLNQVLIEQKYSFKDDLKHIRWLSNVFKDKRYIRINNKPLFIVYRPSLLPNPKKTIETWRKEARRLGIGEIYLCMIHSFPEDWQDPREWGFDAAIEWQPDRRLRESLNNQKRWQKSVYKNFINKDGSIKEFLYSYKTTIKLSLKQALPKYKRYSCIMPSWDNSARRKSGSTIYVDSTPQLYQQWVLNLLKQTKPYSKEENIIFINSWNEWAEGCYLEPDNKWGDQYLKAHQKAVELYNNSSQ